MAVWKEVVYRRILNIMDEANQNAFTDMIADGAYDRCFFAKAYKGVPWKLKFFGHTNRHIRLDVFLNILFVSTLRISIVLGTRRQAVLPITRFPVPQIVQRQAVRQSLSFISTIA